MPLDQIAQWATLFVIVSRPEQQVGIEWRIQATCPVRVKLEVLPHIQLCSHSWRQPALLVYYPAYMKSRACAAAVLLVLATAGLAQEGVLRQVVPGVWFREGETRPGTRVILCANSALIEMKDYLIVVDANFPSCA